MNSSQRSAKPREPGSGEPNSALTPVRWHSAVSQQRNLPHLNLFIHCLISRMTGLWGRDRARQCVLEDLWNLVGELRWTPMNLEQNDDDMWHVNGFWKRMPMGNVSFSWSGREASRKRKSLSQVSKNQPSKPALSKDTMWNIMQTTHVPLNVLVATVKKLEKNKWNWCFIWSLYNSKYY